MKKIILLTFALAGTAITSVAIRAAKTKNEQKYTRAVTRYKKLSAALKTNKLLQATIAHNIKQKIPKKQKSAAVQKLGQQLKSLRSNEQLLNKEINDLLQAYPKLKRKK